MTNGEKYKNEILNYINGNFCEDFVKTKILKSYGKECGGMTCVQCRMLQMMWLNEEYKEPEIDWSKVPVNTKILVRDSENGEWVKRYFSEYRNGLVYAFADGATSFSANQNSPTSPWYCAKLYDGGEE